MKKILALILLLGFTASAQAGLAITFDGFPMSEIMLKPASTTATFDLVLESGSNISDYMLDFKLFIAGTSQLTSDVEFLTSHTTFPLPMSYPGTFFGTPGPQSFSIYGSNSGNPVNGPGIIAQNIVLHCLNAGVAETELKIISAGGTIINGQNIPAGTVMRSLMIYNAAPEPMTLMLLGLGSLYLIRRKK